MASLSIARIVDNSRLTVATLCCSPLRFFESSRITLSFSVLPATCRIVGQGPARTRICPHIRFHDLRHTAATRLAQTAELAEGLREKIQRTNCLTFSDA